MEALKSRTYKSQQVLWCVVLIQCAKKTNLNIRSYVSWVFACYTWGSTYKIHRNPARTSMKAATSFSKCLIKLKYFRELYKYQPNILVHKCNRGNIWTTNEMCAPVLAWTSARWQHFYMKITFHKIKMVRIFRKVSPPDRVLSSFHPCLIFIIHTRHLLQSLPLLWLLFH